MRAAFLVLLVMLPAAAGERLATDPAGDQSVTLAGQPVSVARWDALDLLELELAEQRDGFDFKLHAGDLEPQGESMPFLDGLRFDTHFTYRGAHYRTEAHRASSGDDFYWYGRLLVEDPSTGRWDSLGARPLDVDAAQGTISFHLPRDALVGADGAGALRGSQLQDIHVVSGLSSNNRSAVEIFGVQVVHPVHGSDRMPDAGSVAWTIREGVEQSGHARLASTAPVRVSNGEATTFLYQLLASNDGPQQELFALSASGAPESWTVTFPQERVRIEPGQTLPVPVLVTVPFQHQHGSYYGMLVAMQSQQDPESVGRIELGVRYTAVAQPTGHHDTVYFHTASDGQAYFNTLEEDPDDTGEAARSWSSCSCNGWSIARHDVHLLPGLLTGLDLDMARNGTAQVDVLFDQPATGVRVSGELAVYPGDEPTDRGFFSQENEFAVAVLPGVEGLDFEAGQTRRVDLQVRPLPRGDYLPYEQDAWLVLHLDIAVPALTPFCCLVEPDGKMVPGGWMELPLDEYHDDVDEYFATLSGLELFASGPQKRLVNPGETAVFNVSLQNLAETSGNFGLSLAGSDWGRVLGSQQITVAGGSTRQLAVAVDVPQGAADGEQADVTLHAVAAGDDNVRSLIRLLAEVDADEDHVDERALADQLHGSLQDKQATAAWLPAVVGLLCVALRRR